jgi:hypothetical protein
MNTYRLVGEWIDANTPRNATLMLGDLGIVGYYARRHALDSPGLIAPDMYIKTPAYAAIKYKLDYIAAPQYLWNEITWTDWFTYHYVPETAISTAADFEFSPMIVFRRRLPLQTPAELPQGFDLPLTCSVELASGAPIPADTTEARLFANDGALLVEAKHAFLWDAYPQTTAAGDETLIEQIGLPLTVSEPGDYAWEFDCAGDTSTGTVAVLPIEQTGSYTQVVASWPEFASLRGMLLPEGNRVWSGGSLVVGLHFEASGAAETDYNLFIHVLSPDGFLVAQSDGPPQNGARPTNTWAEGETIVDLRRVTLDPALPAGEYTLVLGWYDWRTGERVTASAGQEAITLPLTITNQFPGGTGAP